MDMTAIGGKLLPFIKKYRYVVLVLLVGIGLMLIPGKNTEEEQTQINSTEESHWDQEVQLDEILGQINGVGKVKVLLTYSAGPETVYQINEDTSVSEGASTVQRETVVITDSNRAEIGLIKQTLPPEYLGAVIVCQGADNASVRLAVVEAVSDATGLRADQISVLKMK